MINEINNELIKERVFGKKLQNGLEVFFLPKKDYVKQYAIFAAKYGSNDLAFKLKNEKEDIKVPEGIAHFLEHKLFEEPEGNAFDRFAQLGANVNAYTNFNITAYYFTCTDYFYDNLSALIRFVQSPYFTDENVEKEKGIIGQEIMMYRDNAEWRVFFNLLKAMYHQHPVKRDIAGTIDSVNSITKEDLYQCYNTFYHPSNMALFIAGDLEAEAVFNRVEEAFAQLKNPEADEVKLMYPQEPEDIKESHVEESMQVSIPLFHIGYKDRPLGRGGRELIQREAAVGLLIDIVFGRSSELYEELYEAGLIDQGFGVDYVCEKDYGHVIISGESKAPIAVKEIIDRKILQLQSEGLSRASFERIKRKQIGENLSYFNSIEFIGNSFITYHFKEINFLDYIKILSETSLEAVEDCMQSLLKADKQVISIINP